MIGFSIFNMKLTVSLPGFSYPVWIEKNCLSHLADKLDIQKKTMLVYDSGIPQKWIDLVLQQLGDVSCFCFEQGEGSKNMETYEQLLIVMSQAGLNRKSQVIALGGGVTGDMAGFAAATYMRGIDFINFPTTVLAQVDSSVGGKTAIDLGNIKNIVGAFWQPKAVLIDPNVLDTLDNRQVHAGLVEALKMGLLFDADLVAEYEKEQLDLEKIIARSIDLKRIVVEQDEKESNLRKSLNFGHTIGHGIEGSFENHDYLHGECVGVGMLYFITDPTLRTRILKILNRLEIPKIDHFDSDKVSSLLRKDKKGNEKGIDCVFVDAPGHFYFQTLIPEQIDSLLKEDIYEKHIW